AVEQPISAVWEFYRTAIIDKHDVQGVIDTGFMYHTCVTHLSHAIYVLGIDIIFCCMASILFAMY
ncbi:hypothetical protein, partial [uncultured Parabacteroides sp.]